jgi:hypothetical protein
LLDVYAAVQAALADAPDNILPSQAVAELLPDDNPFKDDDEALLAAIDQALAIQGITAETLDMAIDGAAESPMLEAALMNAQQSLTPADFAALLMAIQTITQADPNADFASDLVLLDIQQMLGPDHPLANDSEALAALVPLLANPLSQITLGDLADLLEAMDMVMQDYPESTPGSLQFAVMVHALLPAENPLSPDMNALNTLIPVFAPTDMLSLAELAALLRAVELAQNENGGVPGSPEFLQMVQLYLPQAHPLLLNEDGLAAALGQ